MTVRFKKINKIALGYLLTGAIVLGLKQSNFLKTAFIDDGPRQAHTCPLSPIFLSQHPRRVAFSPLPSGGLPACAGKLQRARRRLAHRSGKRLGQCRAAQAGRVHVAGLRRVVHQRAGVRRPAVHGAARRDLCRYLGAQTAP